MVVKHWYFGYLGYFGYLVALGAVVLVLVVGKTLTQHLVLRLLGCTRCSGGGW